jgi:dTMP kinase
VPGRRGKQQQLMSESLDQTQTIAATASPHDPSRPPEVPAGDVGMQVRIFGSSAFFRLWLVQVVSATGDWLGFLALYGLARQLGADSADGAIAITVVLIPRLLPGLFLASAGGVIVDRMNRKRLMIYADVGRAMILLAIPLVDQLWWLVIASFLLEIATSLWGPAKEAVMPNLVPTSHLTNANSLSLIAAYGTFPIAAAIWLMLAKVAEYLGGLSAFSFLELNEIRLAIGVDAITFLVAAALVSTIPIVPRPKELRDAARNKKLDFGSGWRDVKEGWSFILTNPRVKAVIMGLGIGMFGGGMLIPLSGGFNKEVLRAGDAGYGALLFSIGIGVAAGVILLGSLQRRLPHEMTFVFALGLAGALLTVAAALSNLLVVSLILVGVGVCAGAIYVLGFTILHSLVEDALRGRIFSALYMIVRFSLLLGIATGGLVAASLGYLSTELVDGSVLLFEREYSLVGVRLALWFSGIVMIVAALYASRLMTKALKGVAE